MQPTIAINVTINLEDTEAQAGPVAAWLLRQFGAPMTVGPLTFITHGEEPETQPELPTPSAKTGRPHKLPPSLQEKRIYLTGRERAPEGFEVFKGPRGGDYFINDGSTAAKEFISARNKRYNQKRKRIAARAS